MSEKILGKIDFVEFGTVSDYPFLIGLQFGFKLGDGCGVMCGGKYTINIKRQKAEIENLNIELQAIKAEVERYEKTAGTLATKKRRNCYRNS